MLPELNWLIADYGKEPWFNICLNINLHKPDADET